MQHYEENYARIGVVPNANRSFGRNAAPDRLQVTAGELLMQDCHAAASLAACGIKTALIAGTCGSGQHHQ